MLSIEVERDLINNLKDVATKHKVDLAETIKNINEKINIIGNKVDIINNHVDLVDEKCDMIVEDGEYRTTMMKSLANDFQNLVEKNDDNTSSIKKLTKDFKDLAIEMKPFFKNDDKTKVSAQERKMKIPEESALISSFSVNDCIDKYTWVGDTGASSHSTNSLDGMFDLRPSDGHIKVGDGQFISIEKIEKNQGIVIQKNGRKENIILTNVFYIPDIYYNLFSSTRAMSDGYTMFGSSKKSILIKNDNVEIVFDCILKSGLGMTMVVKIVPKKLEEFNFMSIDFLTAHSILYHQDKLRTKATALKLGWKT